MKAQQSTTEITIVDEAHWIARYFTYAGIDYFMPFMKAEGEWELLAVIDEEYLPEVEGAAAVAAWLTQRGIPLPAQLLRDVGYALHFPR